MLAKAWKKILLLGVAKLMVLVIFRAAQIPAPNQEYVDRGDRQFRTSTDLSNNATFRRTIYLDVILGSIL